MFDRVQARIEALADVPVNLAAQKVKNLAFRLFKGELTFTPSNSLGMMAGEPYLHMKAADKYTPQQLEKFSDMLDALPNKFKVSYVMPDPDEGPNTLKIVFFKDFRPTQR